jgi:hypothetical protein
MLPKIAALGAFGIAILAILGSYSQITALNLRQENQSLYWARRGTHVSGRRYNNRWYPSPNRSNYDDFRGGGIGAGK